MAEIVHSSPAPGLWWYDLLSTAQTPPNPNTPRVVLGEVFLFYHDPTDLDET